jgi:GNAT superfamily N-acetyltransferase
MTRDLRALSTGVLPDLPTGCVGCVFWETSSPAAFECGSVCDSDAAAGWVAGVTGEWGECGRVAIEDGEVLGFVKYAPGRLVPRARRMLAGPPSPDAVLLTCLHLAPQARRRGLGGLLLHAAMRDLAGRGERVVEAYATSRGGDLSAVPVVGVEFLLRNGFTVTRPHPDTPLLRLELRTLATWTESLDSVLESLRIPVRARRTTPVTSCDAKGSR